MGRDGPQGREAGAWAGDGLGHPSDPQPLTLGRRPWCTQRHPPSWSRRRIEVVVSPGGPWPCGLGRGPRAEQRNSALSLGSNLLLGSGPTVRSWSPKAWASWEGRRHQSPRGLPYILIPKRGRSPGELLGPLSEYPLFPSEGAPFLICWRALCGQGQLTHTPAAPSGCGKPAMTILEPSAPWSTPGHPPR